MPPDIPVSDDVQQRQFPSFISNIYPTIRHQMRNCRYVCVCGGKHILNCFSLFSLQMHQEKVTLSPPNHLAEGGGGVVSFPSSSFYDFFTFRSLHRFSGLFRSSIVWRLQKASIIAFPTPVQELLMRGLVDPPLQSNSFTRPGWQLRATRSPGNAHTR